MNTATSHSAEDLPATGQSACTTTKACLQDTLAHTEAYVRSNPVPVLLGVLAFGVAVGCSLAVASRREATLKERLIDQRVSKFRDALVAALAPVAAQVKKEGASVQNCVERTFSHPGKEWAAQLGKFGRNLKFW